MEEYEKIVRQQEVQQQMKMREETKVWSIETLLGL